MTNKSQHQQQQGSTAVALSQLRNHRGYLGKLLHDTVFLVSEVRSVGIMKDEEKESSMKCLEMVAEVVEKPLAILVMGQSFYSRACVLNAVLDKQIIDLSDLQLLQSNHRWGGLRLTAEDRKRGSGNEESDSCDFESLSPSSFISESGENMSDMCIRSGLLSEEMEIIMASSVISSEMWNELTTQRLLITLYGVDEDQLNEQHITQMKTYYKTITEPAVLFAKVPSIMPVVPQRFKLFQQLCDLEFLLFLPSEQARRRTATRKLESEFVEPFDKFGIIFKGFLCQLLQTYIVRAAGALNEVHEECLSKFILRAFDMAREIQVTPKRVEFARKRELELYRSLMKIATSQHDEMKKVVTETIQACRQDILNQANSYTFKCIEGDELRDAHDLRVCTAELQELVLGTLNCRIAGRVLKSVDKMRETFLGSIQRCLENLEETANKNGDPQACLAFKQILNSAYQLDVAFWKSSSILRSLWDTLKQVFSKMFWIVPPKMTPQWKRRVAEKMLDSLKEDKLARNICSQYRDKLRQSHHNFIDSLKYLEMLHHSRLQNTEAQRVQVKKVWAPKVARLALESTSLKDMVLFGVPKIGRELGRGQYGVVYSCEGQWGGYSPIAVKSVVPPDERHWNDLALEFYYTKNMAEHENVVCIRGSIIDYSYGSGMSPSVLLLMDRFKYDLHTAIRRGLEWMSRLKIALDVVKGVRFLHSQGLVHRDIKLKNVLLDDSNRAKITDLGFCKPEAMMSGSVVGTPIHMAPELLSGNYDSSVDVYALGILFWYICAGHVQLPYVFEQCQSKDQLWHYVKQGARPERLAQMDDDCWSLMTSCWQAKPNHRPLLGEVEERLRAIIQKYRHQPPPNFDMIMSYVEDDVVMYDYTPNHRTISSC